MSDVRFGTDGWRGIIADDFTFGRLRRVALASADYFESQARELGRRVIVGYDRRFFSREFALTVYGVLRARGLEAMLVDRPCPTPAVSLMVKETQSAWGVMLTASHNPALYNGFKIKDKHGRSAPPDVTAAIESRLGREPATGDVRPLDPRHLFDFRPAFFRFLRSRLDMTVLRRLSGRIVFEYLHGVGAGLPEQVLKGSGLQAIALHHEPDPLFGGLHPEPIDPWLNTAKREVRRSRALAGIALDGDADRLGVVDNLGTTLTPHQVFPLLALHAIETRGLKGKVVQAVSLGVLSERIASHFGLPFEEVPVGFKHVAERMLSEPVAAGGEESGGYSIGGGLPERDGVLNGLLLLELCASRRKPLNAIVREMEARFGPSRFRRVDFAVPEPITDKTRFAQQVRSRIPDRLMGQTVQDIRDGDGVKVVLRSGEWVLLRPSGTEPLLRTYAETRSWERTARLLLWAKSLLSTNGSTAGRS